MRSKLRIGFAALMIAGGAFIAGMLVERHFLVVQRATGTSELDGTWQGIQWEGEDGRRADVGAVAMRMTIAGEKLKMTHPIGPIDGFIFSDATQNPKTFHAGGGPLNWVGIYKLEGDTLTLCMDSGQKAERPKEFKSNPAAMLVLKRVKQ
jgi:uncharacterized protein (TIGR03067 family)